MENVPIEMRQINCVTCGIVYFVPAELDRQRRKDGGNFTCPSGHKNFYVETEADRLKKKLDNAESALRDEQNRLFFLRRENAKLQRKISSMKGFITRLKRATDI